MLQNKLAVVSTVRKAASRGRENNWIPGAPSAGLPVLPNASCAPPHPEQGLERLTKGPTDGALTRESIPDPPLEEGPRLDWISKDV